MATLSQLSGLVLPWGSASSSWTGCGGNRALSRNHFCKWYSKLWSEKFVQGLWLIDKWIKDSTHSNKTCTMLLLWNVFYLQWVRIPCDQPILDKATLHCATGHNTSANVSFYHNFTQVGKPKQKIEISNIFCCNDGVYISATLVWSFVVFVYFLVTHKREILFIVSLKSCKSQITVVGVWTEEKKRINLKRWAAWHSWVPVWWNDERTCLFLNWSV